MERRTHHRIDVCAGAFAAVKKRGLFHLWEPRLMKLGPIIDLSLGGLAIHYMENANRVKPFPNISVIITGSGVTLKNIAIRTVSDRIVAQWPHNNTIRRRAFQFCGLSESQSTRLKTLIEAMTTEGASYPLEAA